MKNDIYLDKVRVELLTYTANLLNINVNTDSTYLEMAETVNKIKDISKFRLELKSFILLPRQDSYKYLPALAVFIKFSNSFLEKNIRLTTTSTLK